MIGWTGLQRAAMPRGFVVGVLCALAMIGASAGPLTFGTRTLQVPDPQGFRPISKTAPAHVQLAQAFLPPTNRLVELYVPEETAAVLSKGPAAPPGRYFQVQVLRTLEGVPVSTTEFDAAKADIQRGIDEATKTIQDTIPEQTARGNAEASRVLATDPKMSLSAFGALGTYRDEPWGTFFSFKAHVASAADPQGKDLIGAGGIVLVDSQVVYLYSYSRHGSDADRQWTQQALSTWVDQVRAANVGNSLTNRAVPKGGANYWYGLITGALLGAGIGLIAWLRKRAS